jgi:hypothetical protein
MNEEREEKGTPNMNPLTIDPITIAFATSSAESLEWRFGNAGRVFENAILRSGLLRALEVTASDDGRRFLGAEIDEARRHSLGRLFDPVTDVAIHGWHVDCVEVRRGADSFLVDRWILESRRGADFVAALEIIETAEGPATRVLGWIDRDGALESPIDFASGSGRFARVATESLAPELGALIDRLRETRPERPRNESERPAWSCSDAREAIARLAARERGVETGPVDERALIEHLAVCAECMEWKHEIAPLFEFLEPRAAPSFPLSVVAGTAGAAFGRAIAGPIAAAFVLRFTARSASASAAAANDDEHPIAVVIVDAQTGVRIPGARLGPYTGQYRSADGIPDLFQVDVERLPPRGTALIYCASKAVLCRLEAAYRSGAGTGLGRHELLVRAFADRLAPPPGSPDLANWPRLAAPIAAPAAEPGKSSKATPRFGTISRKLDIRALRGLFGVPSGAGMIIAVDAEDGARADEVRTFE